MKLRRAYSKSLLCLGALMLVLAMSACNRPKAASQCSSDAQCGAGASCSAGVCVVHVDPVVACTRTDDCAPTQVCADNVCVAQSHLDGRCEVVPQELVFDVTPIGMSSNARLTIANYSSASLLVSIGEIHQVKAPGNGTSSAFRFGDGDKAADYVLPARASAENPGLLELSVEFNPDAVGDFAATLQVWRPSYCAREVTLKGTGVVSTCVVKPTVVRADGTVRPVADFGYVNPGAKAGRRITFAEVRTQRTTFTLRDIAQPPQVTGAPFAIEGSPTTFTLSAGGEPAAIDVSFAPTELGLQLGKLEIVSDDPFCTGVEVELQGIGGGPKISAQPAQLDFGPVISDAYQYRHVAVANVGTDVGGTTDDNLVFAMPIDGNWRENPAEVAGVDATEFGVAWPPQGYSAIGLAECQTADLRVKFAPTSEGRKEAVLRIYSNDPDRPTLDIPLMGMGSGAPPCEYEITPSAIDFGLLDNRYLDLPFAIVNRGTNPADVCLVSMLDVDWSTRQRGAFALVNGALGSGAPLVIPGGSSLLVPVRFSPKQDGQYAGEVDFYINSVAMPEAKVTLSAIAAPSCLIIGPRDEDFGNIGINCSSRERTITLYNACSASQVVSAISLRSGTSAEFSVTQQPTLPVTINGGARADLGVTYHPVDIGDDAGTLILTTAGGAAPFVIPLRGRGATDPVQTDLFAQPMAQKVDVLLIIDDSGSMEDKQSKFSGFFTNLMSAAFANGVDYHLAVTTTSANSPVDPSGRFLPLTGSNPRVITPLTPNAEQVFSQNVMVGTEGGPPSLIYPAYLALLNPLINGHNAGFYRDAATLAVVVVSDAADDDPSNHSVSLYETFFRQLKGFGRPQDVSFSGIIPTLATEPPYSSGCSYHTSNAGSDTRVKQLAAATGGVIEEVCSADWSGALGRIGARIFGKTGRYFLSNAPDMTVTPDPIEISIDGIPFPEFSSHGARQWRYDATNNAIDFMPGAEPSPGSSLSISYRVACL